MTKFLDIMMQFQTSLPTTKATSYYLHLGHLSIIQSDPIHSNNLRFSQATFICSMAVHSTTSWGAPDARGQRRPRRGRGAGCGWCNGCGHRSIRSLGVKGRKQKLVGYHQTRSDQDGQVIQIHVIQLQTAILRHWPPCWVQRPTILRHDDKM